jgi:CelD/BcsL family acetyltransferase involved in cellulose biosynthesis
MLTLERLRPELIDWHALDTFGDRVVFQTREWQEFVTRTQAGELVVATVLDGDDTVGCFTGQVVRRFGLRILGSPFPGWTTLSMGFNLREGVSRRDATEALIPFAFGPLNCVHLELKDRLLEVGDIAGLGLKSTPNVTFELDLRGDDAILMGRMTSACRRAVRKAAKTGVVIEEVAGEAFAAEYFEQLVEVFARQELRPSYGVDRVRELIRCLEPTGRLLLLRARGPDGQSIATGIFPAMNGTAYFWGGASKREHQIHRPNEAVFWHAMRYWRDRGMSILDMGGGGDYKRKYGPRELSVPWLRRSRVPALGLARDIAEKVLTRDVR